MSTPSLPRSFMRLILTMSTRLLLVLLMVMGPTLPSICLPCLSLSLFLLPAPVKVYSMFMISSVMFFRLALSAVLI